MSAMSRQLRKSSRRKLVAARTGDVARDAVVDCLQIGFGFSRELDNHFWSRLMPSYLASSRETTSDMVLMRLASASASPRARD